MSGRFRMLVASCACAWALLSSTALASPVLLGFEEPYERGDGKTVVHRGADLAMASGSRVVAPLGGSVVFAGRVPATGGGSILCVTLETRLGTVSLLPLSDVAVTRGDEVSAGHQVGVLAGAGDASSAQEHLHASLRVGGDYVDPSALIEGLIAPAPGAEPAPVAPGEPVSSPAVGLSPEPARAQGAPAGAGPLAGTVPSAVTLPPLEPAAAAVAPVSEAASAPDAGAATRPSAATEPGSANHPSTSNAPTPVTHPVVPALSQAMLRSRTAGATLHASSTRSLSNPRNGARAAGMPVVWERLGRELPAAPVVSGQPAASTAAALASGIARLAGERADAMSSSYAGPIGASIAAAIAMMSYAGLIMLTRRLMARHVRRRGSLPLRLGITLQHPGVGGRLRGLTSCSGPTAFTVPGPPAQRR